MAGYWLAMTTSKLKYTVPGMSEADAERVVDLLQSRLSATNDLHLTLGHVHWNVVGPHFIAVHEMLDPQVDAVRGFADDLAERIATLGGSPVGTPASSSRPAPGTSTASAGPPPRSTWGRSISSTTA